MYYVFAILSLGFLIVVHEGGHYFVARWCGMRIERFSIGFGPGILKRRSKKTGTTFQLAPIPFGGFVEIRGMNIAEDVDPDDLAAYPNRPAWQRFVTIFAGPATNYVSAVVLAFALFAYHGVESSWRWFGVAEVKADYDAFGKLAAGDRIVAIDHKPILAEGVYAQADGTRLKADPNDGLVARVNAKHGAPVTLTVLRDGTQHDVTIQPKPATVMIDGARVPLSRTVPNNCITQVAAATFHLHDVPSALRCDESSTTYFLVGIAPSEQPDFVDVGVLGAAAAALSIRSTRRARSRRDSTASSAAPRKPIRAARSGSSTSSRRRGSSVGSPASSSSCCCRFISGCSICFRCPRSTAAGSRSSATRW